MAKFYKVWIELEEFDDETEEFTSEGLSLEIPGASVASFDTIEEAVALGTRLQAIGEALADGDRCRVLKALDHKNPADLVGSF